MAMLVYRRVYFFFFSQGSWEAIKTAGDPYRLFSDILEDVLPVTSSACVFVTKIGTNFINPKVGVQHVSMPSHSYGSVWHVQDTNSSESVSERGEGLFQHTQPNHPWILGGKFPSVSPTPLAAWRFVSGTGTPTLVGFSVRFWLMWAMKKHLRCLGYILGCPWYLVTGWFHPDISRL